MSVVLHSGQQKTLTCANAIFFCINRVQQWGAETKGGRGGHYCPAHGAQSSQAESLFPNVNDFWSFPFAHTNTRLCLTFTPTATRLPPCLTVPTTNVPSFLCLRDHCHCSVLTRTIKKRRREKKQICGVITPLPPSWINGSMVLHWAKVQASLSFVCLLKVLRHCNRQLPYNEGSREEEALPIVLAKFRFFSLMVTNATGPGRPAETNAPLGGECRAAIVEMCVFSAPLWPKRHITPSSSKRLC